MTRATIPLTEYVTKTLSPEAFPQEAGEILWRDYRSQVAVDFPSPKTDGQWELTPQGWVGYIPVTAELGLQLQPKIALENIFRMLEYAYRLESFEFLAEDVTHVRSLADFYERLANILAKRVLDRARKGLHRAYMPENERLPYVRGRLDARRLAHRPWSAALHCHYEEHTADIEENQILAWTLQRIARSNMCSSRVQPTVRQAYRALHGAASLQPFSPQDCVGRLYNRLNADYHPMHALCRFFLEHSGPTHRVGDRTFMPFLVNMARLYELFVAEWLKQHLQTERLQLKAQDTVTLGKDQNLRFNIDLTLYDTETQAALCILDTKYKAAQTPSASDISQVVTYAEIKGCQDAFLIYPTPLHPPLDQQIGRKRVRSLTFPIAGDLEASGRIFRAELLAALPSNPAQKIAQG